MVSTRSKAKRGSDEQPVAGTKRKEHATSQEEGRESKVAKKQTTIEDTIGGDREQNADEDSMMRDVPPNSEVKDELDEDKTKSKVNVEEPKGETKEAAPDDKVKDSSKESQDKNSNSVQDSKAETKAETTDNGAIEESSQREKKMSSNILEKGIVYFFTRNRVGIEDSESVGDLQRSYFVLRPLPDGATLIDGTIPDSKQNRLLALPKKTFPRSHSDRFMAFVEKTTTTIQELKDTVFKSTEYETKTAGTRRQEPIITVAEGVYAITRTEDRSTHLAYAITIPGELGEVQHDLGLRSQGSFIISVKNPERKGPANARLPQGPDFSKEIIDEFRGLAWAEVKPKYFDYENAQFLLIGEDTGKAMEHTTKDQKAGKDSPEKELEQLEHEDELRVKHLDGDDTVFDDLKLSKNEYSKVPTTW